MFGNRRRLRDLSELSRRVADQEERYRRTGALDDLKQAIALREQIVAAIQVSADRAVPLFNLARALFTLFDRTGHPETLNRAVARADEAVRAIGADADRAAYLSQLGMLLRLRYEQTGSRDDLDRAIEVGRAAVAPECADHAERSIHIGNLATALQARVRATGEVRDLEEVVGLHREAAAAAGRDDPHYATLLSNLSVALRAYYERTGDLAALDEAIDLGERATRPPFTGHPARAAHLSALGVALDDRYERDGNLEDLDRAIAAYTAAVAGTAPGDPMRASYYTNLGSALRHRHERTRDRTTERGARSDLDRAVAAHREAVALTPRGLPRRPVRLSNLAAALVDRYHDTHAPADIDEAVDTARQAVAADGDDPDPARLSTLGVALRTRSELTGDDDLGEALRHFARALTTMPDEHPQLVMVLHSYGIALLAHHVRTGETDTLARAVEAFRSSALTTSGQLLARAVAARFWGEAAHSSGDPGQAVEGFSLAVTLARELAPKRLKRPDQEFRLKQISGLGQEAAAACVDAGLLHRAVELMEDSRAVLITQALLERAA